MDSVIALNYYEREGEREREREREEEEEKKRGKKEEEEEKENKEFGMSPMHKTNYHFREAIKC